MGIMPAASSELKATVQERTDLVFQMLEGHLGVAVFIAHEDHGNAVRQQQRGRQVAHLALPQAKHILLGCLALRATVPAQVVVFPIPAKGSGFWFSHSKCLGCSTG